MKNINNMMKQAQKMQTEILSLQKELENKIVKSSVGGGMVKVSANGSQKILSVEIEKEVVNQNDIKMLEDLVVIAVNDVLNKSKEMASDKMNKITGGIKIPGLV